MSKLKIDRETEDRKVAREEQERKAVTKRPNMKRMKGASLEAELNRRSDGNSLEGFYSCLLQFKSGWFDISENPFKLIELMR